MEIQISDGIVHRIPGDKALMNHRAIQARSIANFLPLLCQRADAKIVHNIDANYTGIRFDTKHGAVVLEVPFGDGPYRLVRELVEPDRAGRTSVEMLRFPQLYKPQGIAHMTAEFLSTRGYLG
ncbi:hypothetical protein [Streptomyces flavofungini]|uniref:Uncharacterized protein n=1 Tax=Streptomyces flavofungini TaxID=68200 RepID=A0ABS0XHC5_9ACTN|nr:hypothetical protein [Streptomyces flavofungini]MBJ3812299.1 hypothetical protein [Streptomyces flavofungini]GHC88618.1 hypothetical protein GCM10010349_76020 [Streptomyces flavofungini]